MDEGADRRRVLAGLVALGVGGCGDLSEIRLAPPGVWDVDLSTLEARHGGRIGVHARDYNWVSWRMNERFLYCSTFKLFLAAATLDRVARYAEQLDRLVPVRPEDLLPHAPVTGKAVGKTLSVEALCQAVVEVSDNPAANILIREMGGLPSLRAWYASIGDDVTRVDRFELELNRPDGDKDTTTPFQTTTNIGKLLTWERPILGDAHRQMLEGWLLASPTGAGRIKAGAPANWLVAHKTGTGGGGPTNDIGLIRPPSRDPISIAIYYDAPPSTTEAQRDAVIADATRAALKALGHG